MHTPDKWLLMKYQTGELAIISGWSGGYLNGDSWRRSSQIEFGASTAPGLLMVSTISSEYQLYESRIGMTGLMANIIAQMNEKMHQSGRQTCEFIDDWDTIVTLVETLDR